MTVAPSVLLILTSQLMGDAQARLRGLAIASTDLDAIDALIKKRDAIDAEQRRVMRANLQIIDSDPAVQNNVAQLTQLAAELAAGVQEMRNVTSAIRSATKFLSIVEKVLALAGIA